MTRTVKAVDLFCGAGGTSTGLVTACRQLGLALDLTAINHWDVAIRTHSTNHGHARHFCQSIETLHPREVVPGGHLDLLVASPECTHFSTARGGRPVTDQKRASGWHVLRWAEVLKVDRILLENVREWRDWGPVGADGKPLKSRRGETYAAFLQALRSLNYRVEERVLNAADYGDATTRERLFIMAARGRAPLPWPEPTHAEQPTLDGRASWRPAKEVIDWSLPGESIFTRKRPLSPNTIRRILTGLKRINGVTLDPFLVPQFGERKGQRPRTHSIHKPLPAVTSHGAGALVQPYLVTLRNNANGRDLGRPVPTISAGGTHHALAEPFLIPHQTFDNHMVDRITKPFRTITGNSSDFALVEPHLSRYNGTDGEPRSVRLPMPTLTAKDRLALVMPVVTVEGHRYHLDIRFRMLQPHELAGAMGFPPDYAFSGTREDRVRQIGNAVAVNLASALCGALLAPLSTQLRAVQRRIA